MVIAVAVAWWLFGRTRASSPEAAEAPDPAAVRAAKDRASLAGLKDQVARARARIPFAMPSTMDGEIEVSGRVIDMYSTMPIGDVEVVLASAAGEASAITDTDGHYSVSVARGMYHAFVRSDAVMTVSRRETVRIPGAPSAALAGAPEPAAMAVVLATADTEHVDFPVVRAGVVEGRVIDRNGAAIAGAVVQASLPLDLRPVLGTDIAESAGDGHFELRVPAGPLALTASHPRYAGVGEPQRVEAKAGVPLQTTIVMTAGCIVTGRVVRADGSAAADGAIERQWGDGANQFGPDAQIAVDGSFRWAGFEEEPVALRAWPWKSPPSPSQRFQCRDGARFDNVVFRLSDEAPALAGVVREADGEPARLTYLHLEPVTPGVETQQERSDIQGDFAFFHMPPGRYRVSVVSERGVASAEVSLPASGVQLTLSGVGSMHGTLPLPDGTLQVDAMSCDDVASAGALTMTRLVALRGGQFQIDQLPACKLRILFAYENHTLAMTIDVPRDGQAEVELAASDMREGMRLPPSFGADDVQDVQEEPTVEGDGEGEAHVDDGPAEADPEPVDEGRPNAAEPPKVDSPLREIDIDSPAIDLLPPKTIHREPIFHK